MTSLIRIHVLGAHCTGRSSTINMLVNGKIVTDYDPVAPNTFFDTIFVDGTMSDLVIVDTVGQEDFRRWLKVHMRQGSGFVIVYAIDDRDSFNEVESWHRDVVEAKGTGDVALVICGNKCDLEEKRVVSRAEGEALAARLHAKFYETSAKENVHIEDTFFTVVREVRSRQAPVECEGWGCCIA